MQLEDMSKDALIALVKRQEQELAKIPAQTGMPVQQPAPVAIPWWVEELEKHWGKGESSHDTRRAAKVACDQFYAAPVAAPVAMPAASVQPETPTQMALRLLKTDEAFRDAVLADVRAAQQPDIGRDATLVELLTPFAAIADLYPSANTGDSHSVLYYEVPESLKLRLGHCRAARAYLATQAAPEVASTPSVTGPEGDSLALCVSDLQNSLDCDNTSEMMSCIDAVSRRMLTLIDAASVAPEVASVSDAGDGLVGYVDADAVAQAKGGKDAKVTIYTLPRLAAGLDVAIYTAPMANVPQVGELSDVALINWLESQDHFHARRWSNGDGKWFGIYDRDRNVRGTGITIRAAIIAAMSAPAKTDKG